MLIVPGTGTALKYIYISTVRSQSEGNKKVHYTLFIVWNLHDDSGTYVLYGMKGNCQLKASDRIERESSLIIQ